MLGASSLFSHFSPLLSSPSVWLCFIYRIFSLLCSSCLLVFIFLFPSASLHHFFALSSTSLFILSQLLLSSLFFSLLFSLRLSSYSLFCFFALLRNFYFCLLRSSFSSHFFLLLTFLLYVIYSFSLFIYVFFLTVFLSSSSLLISFLRSSPRCSSQFLYFAVFRSTSSHFYFFFTFFVLPLLRPSFIAVVLRSFSHFVSFCFSLLFCISSLWPFVLLRGLFLLRSSSSYVLFDLTVLRCSSHIFFCHLLFCSYHFFYSLRSSPSSLFHRTHLFRSTICSPFDSIHPLSSSHYSSLLCAFTLVLSSSSSLNFTYFGLLPSLF